jgi:hypothetical protein
MASHEGRPGSGAAVRHPCARDEQATDQTRARSANAPRTRDTHSAR